MKQLTQIAFPIKVFLRSVQYLGIFRSIVHKNVMKYEKVCVIVTSKYS